MNESNSDKNQCATIIAEIAVSSDNSINNNISVTNENELSKKMTSRKTKRYALSVKERKKQKSAALAQLHGGGLKKYVAVDPIIFRVIDLIRPTAVGLINPYDTDGVLGNTMSQNEDNCIPEIEVLGETQENVSTILFLQ
ncbi:hypothetical protein JTB14_010293 [Gonioctena quinquepunctata]|nr:hypothetical protein JTB14_010293 [Gonioctena quinquepunctata]